MRKKLTVTIALLLIACLITSCGSSAANNKAGASEASANKSETAAVVRVGSLKGPTTMGLVRLISEQEASEQKQYEFEIAAAADELLPKLVSKDLDIALIPANAAAILYNKTRGGITVLDINTLGVLYCVTGDESISSVKDLAGKTVMMTGQGTTPEFVLRYLLAENGVTDCTPEFKSEATEVAAYLAEDPSAIAVLPQPFATAAMLQNEALKSAFSLTEEWDAVSDGSQMVTGVTVVRSEFLKEHPEAVQAFLEAHQASTEYTVSDPEGAAALIEQYGIVAKAAVALKALPFCNIVCLQGEEMKTALSGYLAVLFDQAPESVGGALPEDSFYYTD